ncbi:MAG: hypothetical protein ACTHJR_15335 [Sphingomonas sp.]|uniref:hypothetical protein n=1 Tax=Sphingomonas sp. TaxID=28214 RepID=UPI003F7ED9E9
MATTADTQMHPVVRERFFFFVMALVIAAVTVSGFSFQLVMGRSTFASPWWVHVHGLTFMGWLGIYLTQNYLVWRGDTSLHRKLGLFAAGYVVWMVAVGLSVNTLCAINHRIPFFFEPNVFLVMDWTFVLTFAGLTLSAVRLRGKSDWHRRLMLCGAITVMIPGPARLLPLPFMGTWILWALWCVMAVFVTAAVIYDVRTRGKIHPAYFWGFGVMTLAIALIRPIAFSPPLLHLTHYLMG